MIEHLPQETVDRLTDMRELDLQVQSKQRFHWNMLHIREFHRFLLLLFRFPDSMDTIEKRIARFFHSAYHMPSENLDSEHNSILREYKKILEDTGKLGSALFERTLFREIWFCWPLFGCQRKKFN